MLAFDRGVSEIGILLRFKVENILDTSGFFGKFDVLEWVFNTRALFAMKSGTGKSFCVE